MVSRRKKSVPEVNGATGQLKTSARSDNPAYFRVGSVVSARYKGAYCTAKVKKVVKAVKVKVNFPGVGTKLLPEENVKGSLIAGNIIQAKLHCNDVFQKATVVQVIDKSQYHVVFDDGDVSQVRRSQIVVQGARHFPESDSLDCFPLFYPELFGAPVQPVQISATDQTNRRDSTSDENTSENVGMDEGNVQTPTTPTSEPRVVVPNRWAVAGTQRRFLGVSHRRASKQQMNQLRTNNRSGVNETSSEPPGTSRVNKKRRRRRRRWNKRKAPKKKAKAANPVATFLSTDETTIPKELVKESVSTLDMIRNEKKTSPKKLFVPHVHHGYSYLCITTDKSKSGEHDIKSGCRKRKAFLPQKVVKMRSRRNTEETEIPLIDLTDESSDNECGILQRGISLEEELKCDSPDLGDVRSPGTSSGFGVEREKSESPINESLMSFDEMFAELSRTVLEKNAPIPTGPPDPPAHINFIPNLDKAPGQQGHVMLNYLFKDGVTDSEQRIRLIRDSLNDLMVHYFRTLKKLKKLEDQSSPST